MGKRLIPTSKIVPITQTIAAIIIAYTLLISAVTDNELPINVTSNPLTAVKVIVVLIIVCNLFCSCYTKALVSFTTVVRAVIVWTGFTLLFHVVAVLYGAPVYESVQETWHFACLLATSVVLPCICLVGSSTDDWLRVITTGKTETALEASALITATCSVVGAWLGAFPIPLDWDRPWQVWPISCVFGNLAGYCIGAISCAVYLVCHTTRTCAKKSKAY